MKNTLTKLALAACVATTVSAFADESAPAGKIRMITEATFPPYEYREGNTVVGIVFVFAKETPYEKGEDAKGKRIGVQNGTTSADYVREKLGQEPEMFDSPASAFAALKQGKVDVVIADIDPAKNLVKNEPDYDVSDLLTVEEYAVAIKKGQPELLATVNKVIEALEDSGKLDEIKEEHTARAANLSSAE